MCRRAHAGKVFRPGWPAAGQLAGTAGLDRGGQGCQWGEVARVGSIFRPPDTRPGHWTGAGSDWPVTGMGGRGGA